MGSEGAPDRVLVVGAGLAGLICAHRLQTHGIDVTVLEKGRGPGGRQSTRRETLGEHDLTFDHGAQYFTVRDPEFARFLAPFREGDEPVVRTWDTSIVSIESGTIRARSENTERYVCQPGMNGLARALAEPVHTLYSTRVHTCRREDDTWILVDEEDAELARGAALVITAPAAQALALLPDEAPLRNRLRAMRYAPCWSVMVHFPRSLEQDYGGAFVDRSPLSWIADNDSKPGRNPDGSTGRIVGPARFPRVVLRPSRGHAGGRGRRPPVALPRRSGTNSRPRPGPGAPLALRPADDVGRGTLSVGRGLATRRGRRRLPGGSPCRRSLPQRMDGGPSDPARPRRRGLSPLAPDVRRPRLSDVTRRRVPCPRGPR